MKFHKNIHLAKKALPDYEFDELKEYLLKEWHKVPHYNFLKKTEKPINKVEKAIVKMLGDQNYHIEYWFRWNDEAPWHVDGDEVFERQMQFVEVKDKKEAWGQPSYASYIIYLTVDNVVGGEFECTPNVTWTYGPMRDPDFEPPAGSEVVSIVPKENICVRIVNAPYHRVKRVTEGNRVVMIFSLWKEVPKGYMLYNHWRVDGENIVPSKWPYKE